MSFKRVNKQSPCPICGKGDWCLVSQDGNAAICARIESPKLIGKSSAGWLHVLRDDEPRTPWRTVRRKERPTEPPKDFFALARQYWLALRRLPSCILGLSEQLGVTVESLNDLRTGWNESRSCFSFPMREPNGHVCGLRYRGWDSSKWSERGSKEGLFFLPAALSDYLVIVEGASDASAVMDLGFHSVVGRASCRGNVQQLTTLCRRRRFKKVVIVPDSDEPGTHGAVALAGALESVVPVKLLSLPTKDVRECTRHKENADWLAGRIGEMLKSSSSIEARGDQ